MDQTSKLLSLLFLKNHTIFSLLLILILPVLSYAQIGGSDQCEVYLVDTQLTLKLFKAVENKNLSEKELESIFKPTSKILGTFDTSVSEESLTSQTYRIPKTQLFVTASVYYTDEELQSKSHSSSMRIGIAISKKKVSNVFDAINNAMAELTYDEHTDVIRVKKNIFLNNRPFLIGLECRCNRKDVSEEKNNN
jgi:hypothetical protein